VRFNSQSQVHQGGHDAGLRALAAARDSVGSGVDACVVCGVDSLVNATDMEALSQNGRLHGEDNPQGVIPGEGAASILLTARRHSAQLTPVVRGWGNATETNTVHSDNYSTGEALAQAIARATASAQISEADIAFRVSDMNGERYRAWESFLASTRFYRTRRERLPCQLPAMAVGDIGAASGVLSLVIASTAISRGYAPGPIACCESSASNGSRTAAIVTPAPDGPIPPFRSRYKSE
jgi:3-oxoacyl-[acyl-carrier-protein] synthase-1